MARSRPPLRKIGTSEDESHRDALDSLASAVIARRRRKGPLRPVEKDEDGFAPFVPRGSRGCTKKLAWGGTEVMWKDHGAADGAPARRSLGDVLARHSAVPYSVPPPLFDRWEEVRERLEGRPKIFFLDYDGTLAWIASRPELAKLPMAAQITLEALAKKYPVHLLSGRSRADLEAMVSLPCLRYQGDHGFELDVEPPSFLASLDMASLDVLEAQLAKAVKGIRGVFFERKPYTLAVHYRLAEDGVEAHIRALLHRLLPEADGWECEKGRRVFEVRPNVSWGKGEAIEYLMERLDLPADVVPIAVGDDCTNESAFKALADRGLTIHVNPLGQASSAQYRLRNPTDVHAFLDRVIEESV